MAGADERAELIAQLAERDAQIERLKEQLATALDAIARLTQQADQNSTNSHLPPSSDGPGATARGIRKPKKKPSKRKRGGQKGRRGAHRALLPVAQVQQFVDLFPEACEGCAKFLPQVEDIDTRRYQRVELLLSGPQVTEWRRHAVTCTCGHETRAAYDASVIPSSPFGPRLVSVVGTLTGVYHLSRRSAQRLLLEMFGLKISLGALSQLEARVSKALKSAAGEAHEDVVSAMVKHTDATSWLLAGITMSMWTLSTKLTTVFRIFKDGCRSTIEGMFEDVWGKQTGIFGRELLDYTGLVFEYWRGFEAGKLSRDELKVWMMPVCRRFEATLERIVKACSGSCANLLAHQHALWTFVDIAGVDPTNNLAERDLRSLVIWRKQCFGSQSERGLRFVERVMTVAHTPRKRGRDVLDFLERSVSAHFASTSAPALLET